MNESEDIRKKNPFKVPDGYFESLTGRTMQRIKESDMKSSDTEKSEIRRIRPSAFLALAAAIIGFALISTVMVRAFSDKRNEAKTLADNKIYSEDIINEIDIYMIENELSRSSGIIQGEEAFPDEVIIEYLIRENIEISDIIELF